jgi:AcrR family transcriptional regulator
VNVEHATKRPLRADAERSMRLILEAAEHVLAADPNASMEQIAIAAGVARTTVHRRFANRQAVLDALAVAAARQLAAAVDDGRPDTAPPLVAIHRITANVLQVKSEWTFALDLPPAPGSEAAQLHDEVGHRCLTVLGRAREAGLLDADADLEWARRVYYALIGESLREADARLDPDALAARVVETFLHGFAPAANRAGD